LSQLAALRQAARLGRFSAPANIRVAVWDKPRSDCTVTFPVSWKVACSFRTCSPAMNLPRCRSASCPNSQCSAKPRVWVGSAPVPTSALRFGTNRGPTAPSAFPGSWEVACSFRACSPAMNLPWCRSASCPNSQCSAKPRVWVGSAPVPTSALRFGTNRDPTAPWAFPGSWEGRGEVFRLPNFEWERRTDAPPLHRRLPPMASCTVT